MAQDYAEIKRQNERDELRTFAGIRNGENGGPVIDLITGREPHAVGATVCIKAGMRAVPWESIRAEKPMIELCEVATPVRSLMSQPHEIYMKVIGEARQRVYRPDLRLEVDAELANMVLAGVPFSQAVSEWRPAKGRSHDVTLIVEVKDDDDRRIDDPIYQQKLELARSAYASRNWKFVTVVRSRDIDNAAIAKSVRNIMLDHDVSLSPGDIDVVRRQLPEGASGRLGDLVSRLGGGARGRAKCAALHVRRIISIDLRHDLGPEAPVIRLPAIMAMFEMSGDYSW